MPSSAKNKNSLKQTLARYSHRASNFLNREIWQSKALHDKSLRGKTYALLRILSIILNGLSNNRLLSRAAALSYYSLIAMGPLIAIIVMVSGFILKRSDDTNLAVTTLNKIVLFIAPTVSELTKLQNSNQDDPAVVQAESEVVNQDLVALINNFITEARSGTVGVVGALILIFIGIQLLTSIESAFNEIWGVRRGRTWFQRIVSYWTFISLGAVLGFASVTVLSASAVMRIFDLLPFGIEVTSLFRVLAPFLSFLMIMLMLSWFYRFIPNTTVSFRAALAGAFVVAILLILNHYLSFIYVHRVISQQSLYGSLGIIPVLMIGLYIFWFFVLMGGQITYSVQNADALTHQEAWSNVSEHTRETLSLAAFLIICRRFKDCQPPCSTAELTEQIRAPGHIINECLSRLSDLGFVNGMVSRGKNNEETVRYQPARPLTKITLGDFRQALETYGNNEGAELIHEIDPLIDQFRDAVGKFTATELGRQSIESLLEESEK